RSSSREGRSSPRLIPRRAAGSFVPTIPAPAGFASRIVPRRSIKNVASAATSNNCRNRASDRRTSCSERLRSVMSRATVEPPISRPTPSRRGETETETTILCPSLRIRTVSKGSIRSPFRSLAMTRSNSLRRSSGTIRSTFLPIASAAPRLRADLDLLVPDRPAFREPFAEDPPLLLIDPQVEVQRRSSDHLVPIVPEHAEELEVHLEEAAVLQRADAHRHWARMERLL